MNRKNTATAAVAARERTMELNRGFNPSPGNRIHPRGGLLPVLARARDSARTRRCLLGVVCGPERTAAGMPAKRNPRESEKGTKGERNEKIGVW